MKKESLLELGLVYGYDYTNTLEQLEKRMGEIPEDFFDYAALVIENQGAEIFFDEINSNQPLEDHIFLYHNYIQGVIDPSGKLKSGYLYNSIQKWYYRSLHEATKGFIIFEVLDKGDHINIRSWLLNDVSKTTSIDDLFNETNLINLGASPQSMGDIFKRNIRKQDNHKWISKLIQA